MVRDDDDGRVADLRQVMRVTELGTWTKKAVGKDMVNALRERIARVVVPSVVGNEPLFERQQGLWSGNVDFALEDGPDISQGAQVLADQEFENRSDQHVSAQTAGLHIHRGLSLPCRTSCE